MTDSRKQYLRQQIVERAMRVDEVGWLAPLASAAWGAARVAGPMVARAASRSRLGKAALRGGVAAAKTGVRGVKKGLKYALGGSVADVGMTAAEMAVKGGGKVASAANDASDELADVLKTQREKRKAKKEAEKEAREKAGTAPENQQDNYGVSNNVSEALHTAYAGVGRLINELSSETIERALARADQRLRGSGGPQSRQHRYGSAGSRYKNETEAQNQRVAQIEKVKKGLQKRKAREEEEKKQREAKAKQAEAKKQKAQRTRTRRRDRRAQNIGRSERGTIRRDVFIDPETGEETKTRKRDAVLRAYKERAVDKLADVPGKVARGAGSAVKKSLTLPYKALKGKGKKGKYTFDHTEYQRIGSIIAEKSAAWTRKEGKNPSGGLNAKGVASYRAKNPGSKLKTAVTTKPSKLKKGSKAAKRRRSFCARMSGMRKRQKASNNTGKDRLSLSLKKWNC